MTTLIICIIIYVLSVLKTRDFYQKAHFHKEGRWNRLFPTTTDIFITFMPLLNTMFAIYVLFDSPYRKSSKLNKSKNLTEFIFKPRKDKNETA